MRFITALLLCLALPIHVQGQSVVQLTPERDNTLYEDPTGGLSNGAGDYFFAGKTGLGGQERIRRGLLLFPISGNIPSGSTIDSVSLTLFMSRTISGPKSVSLHRVSTDWGEGSSNALGEEGNGAPAQTGDATWLHTFFNTTLWTSAGGDYLPSPHASQMVDTIGYYVWGSTSQLVADVQLWLDTPSSNYGWAIVGDESSGSTSKRFNTSENPLAATRPLLRVVFDEPNDVSEPEGIPNSVALLQNFPNPFNPTTTIRYTIPQEYHVTLLVFDNLGRKVTELVNAHQGRGFYSIAWEGVNDAGREVAGGVYYYRLQAGTHVNIGKMILLK